jgi:hypothetical protein
MVVMCMSKGMLRFFFFCFCFVWVGFLMMARFGSVHSELARLLSPHVYFFLCLGMIRYTNNIKTFNGGAPFASGLQTDGNSS